MSVGNLKTNGNKGNNFPFQLAVLKLLEQVATNTGGGPGADYELVNTDYQAIANGTGYFIGDSITRTLVLSVPTGVVVTTVWWNNTTGLQISPAPPYMDLQQVTVSTSVTVTNGAGALAVNIQDGGNSITVDIDKSATSTNTSVARAITVGGVLILAANTARKGATIINNSAAVLFLKFDVIGTTSATSFTVRLVANAYYEVPFEYTGAISGIWASAGVGTALISELT